MSYELVGLLILATWPLTGLVLGVVMARRGYSGFGWGVIGAILGPVGVLAALTAYVPPREDDVLEAGKAGAGVVDVLIGVDGSWESRHAATKACSLFADRLGRLTLATVVPFDATSEEERAAEHALADANGALRVSGVIDHLVPGQVVLHGRPADSLRRYAADEGYEAIAIGCHGHGMSKAVLGSTADALTRHSEVPLIVAGGHDPAAPHSMAEAGSGGRLGRRPPR